jgi:hypothetical protein
MDEEGVIDLKSSTELKKNLKDKKKNNKENDESK